jgi:hypothetical protein
VVGLGCGRYSPLWTGRVSFLFIRGFVTDKNRRMPPDPAWLRPTDTTPDIERRAGTDSIQRSPSTIKTPDESKRHAA